jgi:hypothetical protein
MSLFGAGPSRYAASVNEGFDHGDRSGVYLKPILRTVRGEHEGGALVRLERAGASAAFDEIDALLRERREPAIFTPPVFAGDAIRGTSNPLFAVRALREFVTICLHCSPLARR